MKLNNYMNVRGMNATFAILIAAMMALSMSAVVMADTEPNDTFARAETTYDGAIESGTLDEMTDFSDYFMIYLNSGENINLVLTMSDYGYDFDLTLYNSAQNEVDYSSTASSEMIDYAVTNSGNYYIEIFALSGTGSYMMFVDVSEGNIDTGDITVGGPSYVSGQPLATLPTMTVGDSAYFGGIKDIGEEYKAQIDEALQNLSDMGFDVNYDISGGLGAYMGWEVISNNANINGNTCYDLQLTGALAIDFGLDGSVDGSMDLGTYGGTVTVDGSGSGSLQFEATLDGHMYLTVDKMAIAKLQLTIKAEGNFEANVDATASMQAQTMKIKADASADIEGVQIDFLLEFNPPLDMFQYGNGNNIEGIYEGKEWYVPAVDTEVSGSITAQGTISYNVNAVITGEDSVHESNTTNLANEIGDNDFSETIPGGQYGGTMFTCTYASGNIFIIETEMGDMLGMSDSPFLGTRQFDSLLDPTSMMPSTGMQLDKEKGMITGVTMDGEAMTAEVPKAEVESFVDAPLEEVTAETGGASTGTGSLLMILVIVIVIVVVIVVVVMVVMRKKTPPQQQHPQPMYQQPPPPPQQYQPQYQQTPPPPQQYPPQDQYGHNPPPPPGQ